MMDMWTPPQGATPQQYRGPADPRNGPQRIGERFADLSRQMRDGLNHLLQAAGIRVEPGKLIIEGDLEVPNGSIRNDALSTPVLPAPFYQHESNFATPNTYTTIAEASLTTPVGFTKAVIVATAWARLLNTSAGAGSFTVLASIAGVAGPTAVANDIGSGLLGTAQSTYSGLVTGLTDGATVTVRTRAFASPAFTADVNSEASINGIVLWTR